MNEIIEFNDDNLIINKNNLYYFDIKSKTKKFAINIEKNINATLVLFWNNYLNYININCKEKSKIKIINIYNINKKYDFKISYNLDEESNCKIYDINCIDDDFLAKVDLNLNGYKSRVIYTLSSISKNSNIKIYKVKSNHLSKNTYSEINTYQIIKNKSLQEIDCVSYIKKGMSKSKAHQKLKLLVFDKTAIAKSNPTLLIKENDIQANHANSIGTLDPYQMFYLQSRGLTKNEAKKLIVISYFDITVNQIENDKIKKDIMKVIV